MFRRNPPAPAKNGHKNLNGNGHKSGEADGNGRHREEAAAPAKTSASIETVIGANASFNGALSSSAGVRIDGGFDGTIEVNGSLVVGEGARVVAETIRAQVVSVAGSVKGNIIADKVQILPTGRIYGDLDVIAFVTEEGAVLRGNVTMRDETGIGDETRPVSAIGDTGHRPE